jgi:hypothetical protein
MVATIADAVFDAALQYIVTNCDGLYITSQQATTYTGASSTYALGHKTPPSIGAPADDTSGRKVTVAAITDGTVTGSGTASHYALTYSTGTALLVAQALSAPQGVTSGNTFTLAAFKIAIPDPTA